MDTKISVLGAADIEENVRALAGIVSASVANGAAISFMLPFDEDDAVAYWMGEVIPEVVAGRRTAFRATTGDQLVGTVQLITDLPPNQTHRCELAKMIVHPSARRQGVGRALILHALEHARHIAKKLITLDTRTGDLAAPLYQSVGFTSAGTIPDFAWDPDGRAMHSTTYMYQKLEAGS